MMLAGNFSIKDKGRIEEIKAKGKVLQSDNFGVAYLRKETDINPRFAFIISTKISKLAVHRNRIKRSLHEGVRRVLNEIPKSFDFVFLAKKSITSRSTEELIKEVCIFFEKVKIS